MEVAGERCGRNRERRGHHGNLEDGADEAREVDDSAMGRGHKGGAAAGLWWSRQLGFGGRGKEVSDTVAEHAGGLEACDAGDGREHERETRVSSWAWQNSASESDGGDVSWARLQRQRIDGGDDGLNGCCWRRATEMTSWAGWRQIGST
ncbi:hypothetical protein M0R45_006354 [Rubus argutus]|uniref:Uncharacterized protein n=1 Tax=Rubus argutus TaxID=59490 RepID=A0AAW1YQS7_RUBAR